jgi:hypothetical protein
VVNEVQTGGTTASDEFIELYNPCATPFDLNGWVIAYRSASNTNAASGTDSTHRKFVAGMSIDALGYFVVCGTDFAGMCDGLYGSGILAAAGGAVGVRDVAGTLLDSVAWGTVSSTNAFIETAPAVAPAASHSIGRLPNGVDTNDNSKDFQALTATSPDAKNQ